jgi:hypothetical protein
LATAFRRLSLESAIAVTLPCMIAHPFRDFQGGVPKKSFFGLFLQLGRVELALLVATLTAWVWAFLPAAGAAE